MRTSGWLLAVVCACGGGSDPTPEPDGPAIVADAPSDSSSGTACTGATYDPCGDNTQCGEMNCSGDNTTCPVDVTGANGFCSGMGICKPALANDCTR